MYVWVSCLSEKVILDLRKGYTVPERVFCTKSDQRTYHLMLRNDVFRFLIPRRQRLQLRLTDTWTCRQLRRESWRSASSFSGTHHAGVCGPPTWSPYLPPRRLCSLSTVVAIRIHDVGEYNAARLESTNSVLLFIFWDFVTNVHYLKFIGGN